jgi:hypothetical protein
MKLDQLVKEWAGQADAACWAADDAVGFAQMRTVAGAVPLSAHRKGSQGDQGGPGQQDDRLRRDRGYRSEPDAICMMIPAAAATIPVTFSLPAADSVGRVLVDSCMGCLQLSDRQVG